MECKICSENSEVIFSELVLNRYNVKYYQCTKCFFIQTEKPFWLDEAYSNSMTKYDIGILWRNKLMVSRLIIILRILFPKFKKGLDFGGGYGIFVRMMRDNGFNFFLLDKYAPNLFANKFTLEDEDLQKYDIVTCFEVLEHLENPILEIENMLLYSRNICFSTVLIPDREAISSKKWWYFLFDTGQHISLYSKESLKILAHKYGLNFYSNNVDFHLITEKKISNILFKMISNRYVCSIISPLLRKRTLVPEDLNTLRNSK